MTLAKAYQFRQLVLNLNSMALESEYDSNYAGRVGQIFERLQSMNVRSVAS